MLFQAFTAKASLSYPYVTNSNIKENNMPRKLATKEQVLTRFLKKLSVAENGCWNWNGAMRVGGYGKAFLPGPIELAAHRLSWILHRGEIPRGLYICHTCDNRKCVNPDHLFPGTHDDNMKDGVGKKRFLHGLARVEANNPKFGSAHPNSRLKEENIHEIISLKKRGLSYTEIGAMYDVSFQTIFDVIKGHTWSHISGVKKV